MLFVFYKLRAEENLQDILKIARELKLDVAFIPRESMNIDYEKLRNIKHFDLLDYDSFLKKVGSKKIAFIETCGTRFVHEVDLSEFSAFVFGSEDYGIDPCDIKKAKNYEVLKIPILSESYKVVSSFVMVLTELKLQGIL